MDERLERALDFSNYRMILSTRQKNLKTLFENKLLFHYESGIFKADKEFLTFVFLIQKNPLNREGYIFIDQNDTPILISDLQEFYKLIDERYSTSLKQYYESYQKLSEARDIRKALDWENGE